MRTILLATDGSSGAERAAEIAARHAQATGATLHILTVGGATSGRDLDQLARAEGPLGDVLSALSEQALARAEAVVRAAGVTAVEREVGWGDPAEVIIETARRLGADAVVLGRRGLGRLKGLLLGSVSQKVATHADCVVILVP